MSIKETNNKNEIRSSFKELGDLCFEIFKQFVKYIQSIDDPTVAISSHTEPKFIEYSDGTKSITHHIYPILDFNELFIIKERFPEIFPKFLDVKKIQRIQELHDFLLKHTPGSTFLNFYKQFSFKDKKFDRNNVQIVIEHFLDLQPENMLSVTLFLPLDNLDLEGATWTFSDGTVLREINSQEFVRHMESTRGEWQHYISSFRLEPEYVLARTFTVNISEDLRISKPDSEKCIEYSTILKIWADSLLLGLPNPFYISSGYTYSNNPYAKFGCVWMRQIFHPLTTFIPLSNFTPPKKCRIDDSLKKRIEIIYSTLSRLHSDPFQETFKPREFNISFRRLETSMRRKEFVDAILDNAIGIEILLTRSGEMEALKFKVERRGSFLLTPPTQRSKIAKKISKLYIIRSKLVHSATEIKPKHVREFIGSVNEIKNEERFKIRWEIFHLHRKILVQYLKALLFVWDSSDLEIKKHDDLIDLFDDLMLQGSKIPRLYN